MPYDQPSSGTGGYSPGSFDATHVFESGLLSDAGQRSDPFGEHTSATGVIPAYDDAFERGATARIDFGPHESFGPPPEDEEPEPEGDASHVFTRLRRIRSHARTPRRRKGGLAWIMVVLVLFAGAAGLRFIPGAPFYPKDGVPEATEPPTMPFRDAVFSVDDLATQGFVSWAYQDRRDSSVNGSPNATEPSPTASMLAVWLAADLLGRAAETGQPPTDEDRADIELMIRDDDLTAADRVLAKLGELEGSVERLRSMCRLDDDIVLGESWLDTQMSARDAARMAGCIAEGWAAGAEGTPWLVNAMRQVRGSGDFGIRKAFPAQERPKIAIKNGLRHDEATGQWQGSCLAIGETWTLVVMQRYPATDDPVADRAHIDTVCQQVVWRLTGTQ